MKFTLLTLGAVLSLTGLFARLDIIFMTYLAQSIIWNAVAVCLWIIICLGEKP